MSSGDIECDFLAMLIEKSNGNISGVLELKSNLSLDRVQKVYSYWVELTMPQEEREKRMRKEADKAAQEIAEKLMSSSVESEENQESLSNFFDIYKRAQNDKV